MLFAVFILQEARCISTLIVGVCGTMVRFRSRRKTGCLLGTAVALCRPRNSRYTKTARLALNY